MRRILVLLIAVSTAVPASAEPTSRYIVALKAHKGTAALRITSNAAEAASHNVRTFKTADFIAADLTPTEAAAMKKTEGVGYVSPVVPRYATDVAAGSRPALRKGSQTSRYAQWQTIPEGIDAVRARDLWPLTRGEVNVALLDTGMDYNHPDLAARFAGGYNAFNNNTQPVDDFGHGTHVAGTIAAENNTFGVVGVAPTVKIWAVKVLDDHGSGSDETVMAGLDWVINTKRVMGGNWIINMSLGAPAASDAERQMVARTIDENILVVAAAGNVGAKFIDVPASYPGVLAISAIDRTGTLAKFSSYGPGIAFAAPGVDVLSTVPVGSVPAATIEKSATELTALPLGGSSFGEVAAPAVFCGLGKPEEIPPGVRGKIAIVRRGELWFRDKVRNAMSAGAVGVIIVPVADDVMRMNWTLLPTPDDAEYPWPVVVSTSRDDGEALIAAAGHEIIKLRYSLDDYALHSGTSMAAPHVTGVAALIWSLAPSASAAQVALAMKLSAADLGDPGYDMKFGYGRIDALAAARTIAPGLFGLPPTPPPPDNRRRSTGRGH